MISKNVPQKWNDIIRVYLPDGVPMPRAEDVPVLVESCPRIGDATVQGGGCLVGFELDEVTHGLARRCHCFLMLRGDVDANLGTQGGNMRRPHVG